LQLKNAWLLIRMRIPNTDPDLMTDEKMKKALQDHKYIVVDFLHIKVFIEKLRCEKPIWTFFKY